MLKLLYFNMRFGWKKYSSTCFASTCSLQTISLLRELCFVEPWSQTMHYATELSLLAHKTPLYTSNFYECNVRQGLRLHKLSHKLRTKHHSLDELRNNISRLRHDSSPHLEIIRQGRLKHTLASHSR